MYILPSYLNKTSKSLSCYFRINEYPKIYSINYGLSMALRFGNTSTTSYYIRSSFGIADLQISGVAFYYGNIQDSIVMVSKKGMFINLVAGQQIMMQKGVSFFYQAKVGYLVAPEIRAVNFITGKEETVSVKDMNLGYKLKYSQFFIEAGFTFKI